LVAKIPTPLESNTKKKDIKGTRESFKDHDLLDVEGKQDHENETHTIDKAPPKCVHTYIERQCICRTSQLRQDEKINLYYA
jgi:hypothetical protein